MYFNKCVWLILELEFPLPMCVCFLRLRLPWDFTFLFLANTVSFLQTSLYVTNCILDNVTNSDQSHLILGGRGWPCILTYRPHALHTGAPALSLLQRLVLAVSQLLHLVSGPINIFRLGFWKIRIIALHCWKLKGSIVEILGLYD